MEAAFDSVVFDLGNVLIEWDPRRLFTDECLAQIDFFTWNAELDRGAPFAQTVAGARERFPRWADAIDAFRDRWQDILGPVDREVLAVAERFKANGAGIYVLSNSSTETLPRSDAVRELLAHFDGVLLSGEVGVLKPSPEIFAIAAERFDIDPAQTLFVDDSQANVDAAIACGWRGHRFTAAELIPTGAQSS